MRAALRDRLGEIHTATGRKVSIVGWSLGGIYAREIARSAPDDIRDVIRRRRDEMNEMGVESWLRQLLEVLETGGATGARR